MCGVSIKKRTSLRKTETKKGIKRYNIVNGKRKRRQSGEKAEDSEWRLV